MCSLFTSTDVFCYKRIERFFVSGQGMKFTQNMGSDDRWY